MCNTCDGSGFIVTCIDDMCRGAGVCMHGDGEELCPECGGDDADYYDADDELDEADVEEEARAFYEEHAQ